MASLLTKYGQWALVTGASSGIGKEFALELAKQGFDLVVVARRKDLLDELSQELKNNYKTKTRVVNLDLTADGAVQDLYDQLSDLDIGLVIPAAGIDGMGQFLDKDYAALNDLIKINVNVPTQLAHIFGNKMAERKRSGIILVSSLFAYQGIPNFATYAATKSYILTLGEALTVEMRKSGIDVLTLSPGLTDTPFAHGLELNTARLPMIAQNPATVARVGLRNLGRKMSVVSGFINKVYAWENRLLPRSWPVKLFGFLIGGAIKSHKRKAASKT